jgi:hypothetical protein
MSTEAVDGLLLGDPPQKSKAAQLLELLPGIEAAVRAGHSHASIHEYLVKSRGLDLTFRYYELTVCRLRKRVHLSNSRLTTASPQPKQNNHNNQAKPASVKEIPTFAKATSKTQDILFGSASDFFS